MIYLKNKAGKGILCRNAHWPKRSGRGTSWDYTIFIINGKNVQADIDTTWGKYFYFLWNEVYYKVVHWAIWTGAGADYSLKFDVITKRTFDSIEKQDDLM